MNKRILITGGAGYIGSVLTAYFLDRNFEIVVIDDLSTGNSSMVDTRAIFLNGSVLDKTFLIKALTDIDTVIHCAAKSIVEESFLMQKEYIQVNINGTRTLLEAMNSSGVGKIIFSSTASVYGNSEIQPISENMLTNPVNPYGQSKYSAEELLSEYCLKGLSAITFRFFNIAGSYESSGKNLFFENHKNESHLIPKLIKAMLQNVQNTSFDIYGDSWPTTDGSCIRDYLHVTDLARAHMLALNKFEKGMNKVINLGSGIGYSVLQVVKELEGVLGSKVHTRVSPPRKGDTAILLASIAKAEKELGWVPKANLNEIIASSLQGIIKQR